MNPLNLLFVLPAYEPAWPLGGVVRCMSNLCRGLTDQGHRVTVYTINTDGHGAKLSIPSGQAVNQGGVVTWFLPSTFGPQSVFDSRALIKKLIETAKQFDLVYLSAIWQWLGVAAAAACGKADVPLVIGAHGSFSKSLRHIRGARKFLYWQLFLKRSLSHAWAIHLTTDHERRESADLLGDYKSFIVFNGLDCNYFKPLQDQGRHFRERLNIPATAPLMITVCRAIPTKRVDLLIQATAAIPELNLLVVGPEPGNATRNRWEELARQSEAADRTHWAGYLKGESLLEAYAAANLFALISPNENFCMAVVEAMACGLPILANAEIGVFEEVRGVNGVLAAEQNLDSITGTLKYFLAHRESWPVWQKNCRKASVENFANETVAAQMGRAFQDILEGVQTPACRWETGNRRSQRPRL